MKKYLLLFFCVAGVSLGNCFGQDAPAPAPQGQEKAADHPAQGEAKDKKEGISTPRKIAGWGMLAFLVIWLFTKDRKKGPAEEAVEIEEPENDAV